MRQREKSIVVLDIGNGQIKTLLGSLDETSPEIRPFFELQGTVYKTGGISKRGTIHNRKGFAYTVRKALETLISFSGHNVDNVYVLYTHPGIRFVKKRASMQNINKRPHGIYVTEKWLDALKEKILDSLEQKHRNEKCTYFEVVSIIVDGEEVLHDPYEHNITQSLVIEYIYTLEPMIFIENMLEGIGQSANIELIRPTAIANKELADDEQKEQGIIICDVGTEFTNVTAYQDGTLLGVTAIPFGGNTITNEIALHKKIAVQEAEKIKQDIADEDDPPLKKTEIQTIEKKITAHLKEHLTSYIKDLDSKKDFPGGIMLIGGGGMYENIEKIIEKATGLYTFRRTATWHVQSQRRGQQIIWHSAYSMLHSAALNEKDSTTVSGRNNDSLWGKLIRILHNISKILR